MVRNYVRLPEDDDVFLEGLQRHGGKTLDYAAELGCSESAVYSRARLISARRGLPAASRVGIGAIRKAQPAVTLANLVDEVTAARSDLVALLAKVDQLLARPPTVIQEWRPSHRRIKDGGEPVRKQRRRIRSELRPADVAPDWRQNRPDRTGQTRQTA